MSLPPRQMMQRGGCARLRSVLWLIALVLIAATTGVSANETIRVTSALEWQYQWGNFAVGDNTFDTADKWQPIDYPANPDNRNDRQYVWFKTILPEANVDKPVFFATSINLTVAAYLDGEKIYQFGEVSTAESPRFRGWPWHAIDLPADYAGKTLALKIFSDYTDIGLWGEVSLVDRSDLQLQLIKSGLDELVIAAFSLTLAFTALLFVMMRRDNTSFLYLGLFALATSGNLLGENLAVQMLFDQPLLKVYIAAMSYFAMPVFMALLLSCWCQPEARRQYQWLATGHAVYLMTALVLSLAGLVNLSIFYPLFDLLFVLSSLWMLRLAAEHFADLSHEQKVVMLAFLLYLLFLYADMLFAHGVLPWMDFPLSLGALLFTLIVAVVSLHHYKLIQDKLREMNEVLEERVAERTERLQAYVDDEVERSQELARINQYSLGLEELISQLQKTADLPRAGRLICEHIPRIFAPHQMNIDFAEQAAPVCESGTITRHLINVEDIQGQVRPFIVIDCSESPADDDSQALMGEFIQRTLARLQVTLNSISLRESLQKMSFEDALTGLKNRRFFDQSLEREQHLAQRLNQPLALLICDIDHFKRFNDRYGHDAGDMALLNVATIMLEHFRETDIPCRFGGEEFVVIMPGASADDAYARAQALLKKVADKRINYQQRELDSLTISIGIACWDASNTSVGDLLLAADKALYQAKAAGRNQVVLANSSLTKSVREN